MGRDGKSLEDSKKRLEADLFKVLIQSKVVSHLSSTLKTKVPFYQFTRLYDALCIETPEVAQNFLKGVHNLIQAGFLKIIVVDLFTHQVQFIKSTDYDRLVDAEKYHFWLVPKEIVLNTLPLN